jgi:hypothetical protein
MLFYGKNIGLFVLMFEKQSFFILSNYDKKWIFKIKATPPMLFYSESSIIMDFMFEKYLFRSFYKN